MRFGWSLTLFVSFVLALSGCGGDAGDVTGTVTLDGKPIKAHVEFTPKDGGRMVSAETDESGEFELIYTRDQKALPQGEYMVSITRSSPEEDDDRANQALPPLPPSYNTESTLTREVKSGSNEFKFDLKSTGE